MRTVELPEELVEQMLIRLPVHTLLRFRCVSKTWRSLIDSPSFVKSHLSNNPNSKIYVFNSLDFDLSMISLAEVNLTFGGVHLSNCPDRQISSLPVPMHPPRLHMAVVGSCDGLICISHRSYFTEIVFINPSTREYRLLPPSSKPFPSCEVFGMGYDCSADEYKVVLIPPKGNEVYIYGSKSNTWRQVDVSSVYPSSIDPVGYGCYGVYAHGALHWTMCCSEQRFWIAAFDLVDEKFTKVGYNRGFFGNPDYLRLKVVGGQLCLFCRHKQKYGEDYTVIWVMKEYGVRESWSVLACIAGYVEPIAFSTCGKHLLMDAHDLLGRCCGSFRWYDLDKRFMGIECTISGSLSEYHSLPAKPYPSGGEAWLGGLQQTIYVIGNSGLDLSLL